MERLYRKRRERQSRGTSNQAGQFHESGETSYSVLFRRRSMPAKQPAPKRISQKPSCFYLLEMQPL